MFVNASSQLRAVSLLDGGLSWNFSSSSSGLHTAPLVVGPHVIIASPTQLFVLDKQTGAVLSSELINDVQGPDEQNVTRPLAGFAEADGMLFVPVGSAIAAY